MRKNQIRTRHARKIREGILLARKVIDTYVEHVIENEEFILCYEHFDLTQLNCDLRILRSRVAFRKALDSGKLATRAYGHTTRRSWKEDVRLRRAVVTSKMENNHGLD